MKRVEVSMLKFIAKTTVFVIVLGVALSNCSKKNNNPSAARSTGAGQKSNAVVPATIPGLTAGVNRSLVQDAIPVGSGSLLDWLKQGFDVSFAFDSNNCFKRVLYNIPAGVGQIPTTAGPAGNLDAIEVYASECSSSQTPDSAVGVFSYDQGQEAFFSYNSKTNYYTIVGHTSVDANGKLQIASFCTRTNSESNQNFGNDLYNCDFSLDDTATIVKSSFQLTR